MGWVGTNTRCFKEWREKRQRKKVGGLVKDKEEESPRIASHHHHHPGRSTAHRLPLLPFLLLIILLPLRILIILLILLPLSILIPQLRIIVHRHSRCRRLCPFTPLLRRA